MSFNLIESVNTALSGEMTNKMAGTLGESTANVHQSMQIAIPIILIGFVKRADSKKMKYAMNLATNAAWNVNPFNQSPLGYGNANFKGKDYLTSLFGENVPDVSNWISEYTGISSQSSLSLLNMATPAVLAVLGRLILDSNMNKKVFRSFLKSQKKGIFEAESLLGINKKFYNNENGSGQSSKKLKWTFIIILCIGAIGAGWYFLKIQKQSQTPPESVKVTTVVSKDTIQAEPAGSFAFTVKLPDGTLLISKKGGLENQLVSFFSDPKSKTSRRFLFNFDQLEFIPGSTVISNESKTQIQNVALILNAFPKARIKIGGFNDRGGDSVAKKLLTDNRVVSLAAALKAAGVDPKQITGVEGFGSDFAKYAADAADSLREKDKRISISIRSK